jgi:ABC-2 type transport system permease protein
MTRRKTQFRASYLLLIGIVVAVLVGVNVLGTVRFKRFDLTENGAFSVSPAMRQILRELPDVVKATYYVSTDLPEEFRGVRRDTLDRFQELESASGGTFKYEIVDVPQEIFDRAKREGDPGLKRLWDNLIAEGVEPVGLGVQRTAGTEERYIFSTITVAYLDKPKEQIQGHDNPLELEYKLAATIVRLTQKAKPIVAFYDGKPRFEEIPSRSPFMPPQKLSEFSVLVELLRRAGTLDQLDWREIKLTEQDPIPEGTTCLVVAQPSNLSERQKYEINRYISGGGNAIFFISQYAVDTASGQIPFPVTPNSPNLDDLFKAWGFMVGPDLVGDVKTSVDVTVYTRGGARRQWMPMFLLLTGEYLDQHSPLTTRLDGLFFTDATPILLDDKVLAKNGITARTLAHTSPNSWYLPVAGMPFLSPFFDQPQEKDLKGPQNLAVVFQGTFPFEYAGRPVPDWPKPAAPPATIPGPGEQPPSVTTPPVGGELMPPEEPGMAPDEETEEPAAEETEVPTEPESGLPETHLALTGDEEAPEVPAAPEAPAASEDAESPPEPPTAETGPAVPPGGPEEGAPETTPTEQPPVVTPPAVVPPAVAAAVVLKPATVLVVSTVDLVKVSREDLAGSPSLVQERQTFFTNAVETLALGQDLVSIRAKAGPAKPFERTSKSRETVYTLINLLTVPVVVIALGLARYFVRRRSRRVYREKTLS